MTMVYVKPVKECVNQVIYTQMQTVCGKYHYLNNIKKWPNKIYIDGWFFDSCNVLIGQIYEGQLK